MLQEFSMTELRGVERGEDLEPPELIRYLSQSKMRWTPDVVKKINIDFLYAESEIVSLAEANRLDLAGICRVTFIGDPRQILVFRYHNYPTHTRLEQSARNLRVLLLER